MLEFVEAAINKQAEARAGADAAKHLAETAAR